MRTTQFFVLWSACVISGQALAHTRMRANAQISPRSNRDNAKTAPCGDDAKTVPKAFPPGAQVRIDWEETINHPGRYEIRFSPDGLDFSTVLATEIDMRNGTNDLPHSYQKTVTLPNAPCANCVVQLVQVMTDRSPPTNYYTCADVKIEAGAPQPPAPGLPGPVAPQPAPSASPAAALPSTAPSGPTSPSSSSPQPTVAPALRPGPTELRLEWRKEGT